MHVFIARSALTRRMMSIAKGFLGLGGRSRRPSTPMDGDYTLVFWLANTHTRRADEAARGRRTNP
jgi:hypothetical protein